MPEEVLEAHRPPDNAFDGGVVPLDDFVQILVLADPDRNVTLGVERFKEKQVGAALVHGYHAIGLRPMIASRH